MTTTAPSTAADTMPMLPAVAPVDSWPPLREMSADVSQRAFHVLMEAFSRPGTIHQLPEDSFTAPVPAAVVPFLALADLMTPITGLDADGEEAVVAVSRLIGAPIGSAQTARFALALTEPGDFTHLNTGSHWSPETGATLVQRVAALELIDAPATTAPGDWRLSGPGIPPQDDRVVRISGLSGTWLSSRRVLTADYPAGIDCLLITDGGAFLALPRTTVIEVI